MTDDNRTLNDTDAYREFSFYTYLTYHEMRERITKLAKDFPEVVRHETSQSKYGIEPLVSCSDGHGTSGDDDRCVIDVVTLTDFTVPPSQKV